MRPLILSRGAIRFKENRVVRHLLDEATAGRRCSMNELQMFVSTNRGLLADWKEFYQLIGYSTSGFGDIFLGKMAGEADVEAAKLARRLGLK